MEIFAMIALSKWRSFAVSGFLRGHRSDDNITFKSNFDNSYKFAALDFYFQETIGSVFPLENFLKHGKESQCLLTSILSLWGKRAKGEYHGFVTDAPLNDGFCKGLLGRRLG